MRQYIGARYMPKFMGTYDPTTAYEALSVVDNGMGTSYVSNQPTPAGTPLTNTVYWAVYGASSGAIIHLQDQIDDINDELSEIDIIKNAGVDECVFIGDSFGNHIVNSLENDFGFTVTYNNSVGSTGFKNDAFLNQLNAVAATVADPDKVKYVICIGGTNDTPGVTANQVTPLVKAFCIQARTLFPKARILIGFVSTLYDYTQRLQLQYKGNCKYNYFCGVNEANVNAEFIDNLTEVISDCNKWISSDRTHPTTEGYKLLAQLILQAVRRQNTTIPTILPGTSYTKTNTSEGINFSVSYSFVNDGHGNCYLVLPEGMTFATNVTLDNNHNYVVCKTDDLPVTPIQRVKQLITISSTKKAWLDLSSSGIKLYGGGPADLNDTFASLQLWESVLIPIPLF